MQGFPAPAATPSPAATASRYATLLVPLYLGLYFVALRMEGRQRTVWLVLTVLLHGHGALWPHHNVEAAAAGFVFGQGDEKPD